MPETAVSSRISATKQLTITRLPQGEQTVLEQDVNGDVQIFSRPFLSPEGGLEYDEAGQLRSTGTSGGAPARGGAASW